VVIHQKKTVPTMAEEPSGDGWVWTAFAPEFRLIVSCVAGPRDEGTAKALIQDMASRLMHPLPLFVSDGYDLYGRMLLEQYGTEFTPPPTGLPGRPAGPQLIPPPDLRYAQVVKHRKGRHLVKVEKRVVFGGSGIPDELISTSKVERQNLNFRNDNRRLTRKTICFSKTLNAHQQQIALQEADHNLVQPHLALRMRCPEYLRPTRWSKRTPAMAAGFTDRIWKLQELLSYRHYITSTN